MRWLIATVMAEFSSSGPSEESSTSSTLPASSESASSLCSPSATFSFFVFLQKSLLIQGPQCSTQVATYVQHKVPHYRAPPPPLPIPTDDGRLSPAGSPRAGGLI